MKKIILSGIVMTSLLFCCNVFADKVTIVGKPVVIEKQADVYVPETATTVSSDGYYYFTMDNSQRVCYKDVQPALAKVDLGVFRFKLGDDTVELHCYDVTPDYFIVQ